MERQNLHIYPAIFDMEGFEEHGAIHIEFPDFPDCVTGAESIKEGLEMARERLAIEILEYEREGKEYPEPSSIAELEEKTSPHQFATLIDVYMPPYRDAFEEKSVKKTVSIPKWLNDLAEKHNVNFSRLLQESLKNYLGVRDRRDIMKR